jgi:predicted MFS family arabinose efflux permease
VGNDGKNLKRERLILVVLTAVQFTTIVDFMVIMPLGPQLKRDLMLTPASFGWIVSSYTFAAGLAGLLATMFIDRYARRTAFLVIFAAFLVGTLACGLASSFVALLAARSLTGMFGGILGGLAMAVVGDVFPEERRGTATGALMSAFAMASVGGVPLGLLLGLRFGWQSPFLALAAFGVPIWIIALRVLPPLDAHLHHKHSDYGLARLWATFIEPNHLRAFALTTALMFGGFAVFPYLSPFLVSNVGVTEAQLPLVYVAGGMLSLVGSPLVGRMADRFGKLRIFQLVVPLNAALLFSVTCLPPVPLTVAVMLTGALMLSNAGRMVPAMAMITSSVEPRRRGGFLSANSAVQHVAAGLGTSFGGLLLAQDSSGVLLHYDRVGAIAALVTLSTLWLAARVKIVGPTAGIPTSDALAAAEMAVDMG